MWHKLMVLWQGVEGIGLPQPDPLKGMYMEFYQGPDAEDKFKTSNYHTITTPHQEWDFVVLTPPTPPQDRSLMGSIGVGY